MLSRQKGGLQTGRPAGVWVAVMETEAAPPAMSGRLRGCRARRREAGDMVSRAYPGERACCACCGKRDRGLLW